MRRLAGSRDGLDRRGRLWGAPTAQGGGALKKNRPYQPNLEDYWRHMTTKQGRGVTQAVAFDAATVGGAWVGVWGSIGELGAHYMCEVRFGSVLRFQLGVQKGTLLPEMKI